MKKRLVLLLICAVLIIAMVIGKIYMTRQEQYADSTFTEAQAAKSIALMFFSEKECEEETKDYFKDQNGSQWYEKYVNILKDRKTEYKLFTAQSDRMTSTLNYSEAKSIMKTLGVTDEVISRLTGNRKDDADITDAEWCMMYEEILRLKLSDKLPEKCELTIAATSNDSESIEPYSAITDRGVVGNEGINMEPYKDMRVVAYIKDDEITLIGSIVETTVSYQNVWVKKSDGETVNAYFNGINRSFKVAGLKDDIKNELADIKVENHRVTALAIKKDRINGKVLEIADKTVEVEGFGKLELEDTFRVYKNIDKLEETDRSSVLVGYDAQSFVVADGKVCAAIIDKKIKPDNIRVLICSNGFKSKFHNNAVLTCAGDFQISYGDKTENIQGGTVIPINQDSPYLAQGRIRFQPLNENDKIQINSLNRSYGNPQYRGSIEVSKGAEGLLIVNELSMEKYLYAVVPSEMPISYGTEALKAQAVCARSYAYRHLLTNSCSELGAHVDDSTKFQVYNNTQESPESIKAVDDTCGEIMTYNGEAISAYFFSTSCGSTTTSEIWGSGSLPYIKGRMVSNDGSSPDLTDEKVFDAFIRSDYAGYDNSFAWYRWNVTMPMVSLTKAINAHIGELYTASPECILTKNENGDFVSKPVSSIGVLQKIYTGQRLQGGVLNEITLVGSDATVRVMHELNIRKVLCPDGNNVNKKDGSVNSQMSMMPSAYFVADEVIENGVATAYTFVGGGYGHGAGMSQNAAKVMSETMKCNDILKFFYSGIKIDTIYSTEKAQ